MVSTRVVKINQPVETPDFRAAKSARLFVCRVATVARAGKEQSESGGEGGMERGDERGSEGAKQGARDSARGRERGGNSRSVREAGARWRGGGGG